MEYTEKLLKLIAILNHKNKLFFFILIIKIHIFPIEIPNAKRHHVPHNHSWNDSNKTGSSCNIRVDLFNQSRNRQFRIYLRSSFAH